MRKKRAVVILLCILIGAGVSFAQMAAGPGNQARRVMQQNLQPVFKINTDEVQKILKQQMRQAHKETEKQGFQFPSAQQAHNLFKDVKQTIYPQLDSGRIDYYNRFLRLVETSPDGLPDVSSPNTLKAYLAFYKLKKYFPNKLPKLAAGHLDENSPILGFSSREFKKLNTLAVAAEYKWLAKKIYQEAYNNMLFAVDHEQARQLAQKELYSYFATSFQMTPAQVDDWVKAFFSDNFSGMTWVLDSDNEWNNWNIEVALNPRGINQDDSFQPFGLVALHEFLHVQNIFPGAPMQKNELDELPTVLQDIMLQDSIYKQINGIKQNKVLTYEHLDLPIGEVAVFLYKQHQQYPNKNMTQLLLLPQVQTFLADFCQRNGF